MTPPQDQFRVLALCARVPGLAAQYELLRQRVFALPSWDDIPLQAQAHGLEPLLYFHLQAAAISIPPHIEQQLRTRTMQHAHANRVRARALAEILDAFQSAGIQALVLKGAALAHLVYPHLGLRVMRDLDILVSKSEAERAQALLARMGYAVPTTDVLHPNGFRHLPVAQREVEGMLISVEVHHNLYHKKRPCGELEALRSASIPFIVEGVTAYALGYEDMLEHVYRHCVEAAIISPIRLIGVADLISLAERFVAEINWMQVPFSVRNALALFQRLTPLSGELLRAGAIDVGDLPEVIEDKRFWDFEGWPRSSLAARREKGYLGLLRDTFYPTEWWLRLYYGVGSGPALLWAKWVRYPLRTVGRAGKYILGRME